MAWTAWTACMAGNSVDCLNCLNGHGQYDATDVLIRIRQLGYFVGPVPTRGL